MGHHYAYLARGEGMRADPAALESAFFRAWKTCRATCPAHPRVPYGITPAQSRAFWGRVVEETFRLAGHNPPPRPSPFYDKLFDHFADAHCWRLYPDTEAALALAVERGFALGVLSNWDHRLHDILWGLGLHHRFELVLTSSEAGVEKPAAEIFRRAETLAPGHRRHALIGDDPVSDGDGALAAGWDYCLIRREEPSSPSSPHPTARTLPAAVEAIAPPGA